MSTSESLPQAVEQVGEQGIASASIFLPAFGGRDALRGKT